MIVISPNLFGSLDVRFPFNAAIKDAVKSMPTARWNPTTKTWTVAVGLASALRVALSQWESEIVWDGIPPPDLPGKPRPKSTDGWAHTLFAAVGAPRADAVFRALSKILHPDTPTGDSTLMRDLIEARDSMNRGRAA